MPDEVIKDRLHLIAEHAAVTEERVRGINEEERFADSKEGSVMIDSLITRLQALSENIKKIQRIDPSFFESAIPLNVNPVVRFRDLVSHHYEKLDEAMVLQICKSDVPVVANAVRTYLDKLK